MPTRQEILSAVVVGIEQTGRTAINPVNPHLSAEEYIGKLIDRAILQHNQQNPYLGKRSKPYDYSVEEAEEILYILEKAINLRPQQGHNLVRAGVTRFSIQNSINLIKNKKV